MGYDSLILDSLLGSEYTTSCCSGIDIGSRNSRTPGTTDRWIAIYYENHQHPPSSLGFSFINPLFLSVFSPFSLRFLSVFSPFSLRFPVFWLPPSSLFSVF